MDLKEGEKYKSNGRGIMTIEKVTKYGVVYSYDFLSDSKFTMTLNDFWSTFGGKLKKVK